MRECLLVELEHSEHLDHTAGVHSPLVVVRNVNVSGQAHSDRHSLLGDDAPASDLTSSDLAASLPDLDYLIEEIGVANLVAGDLSECVDRGNVLVLHIESNLNLTCLGRDGGNSFAWTAHYLQGVSHVWS